MNTHVKIVLLLIVVGAIGLVAYKTVLVEKDDRTQLSTSDAKDIKGQIRIGVDNWVGYLPLCSGEMKKRMRQSGYLLDCVDDQADYAGRMKQLQKRQLDFATATVDSYVLNGDKVNYPGSIVAVIDESKGGDALVAWQDKASTIDDFKNDPSLSVGFTPDSPSEHLLKAIASHFDVAHFSDKKGLWRVESGGSTDALQQLMDKKINAAVLWEPDVSKALTHPNIHKVLGTEDTRNLVVDILLVNREYYREHPGVVSDLLYNYFRTLKFYKQAPEALVSLLAKRDGISEEAAKQVLKGVRWATLSENALAWFGVKVDGIHTQEGLVESIDATLDILLASGDFSSSPLPDNNPYRLTQREVIESLFRTGSSQGFGTSANASVENSLAKRFPALSDSGWTHTRDVGTLRNRLLNFQSGTSVLDEDSQRELDKAAKQLAHYPNFRLVIGGHTGLRGDADANKALSESRAVSVSEYFVSTYGVDKNRLRAIGYGAERPLPKKPGESSRSHNYRLPRVELSLVAEEL